MASVKSKISPERTLNSHERGESPGTPVMHVLMIGVLAALSKKHLTFANLKPYSYVLCVTEWLRIHPMRSSAHLPIPPVARCSICCAAEACQQAGSRKSFPYLVRLFQNTCGSYGVPNWSASAARDGSAFTT